jgi:hypothetical protein
MTLTLKPYEERYLNSLNPKEQKKYLRKKRWKLDRDSERTTIVNKRELVWRYLDDGFRIDLIADRVECSVEYVKFVKKDWESFKDNKLKLQRKL